MSQLLDALEGVANAYEPIPGVVTGGQPGLAHLAALKRAGCEVVLDLRDPMEPRPYRVPDSVTAAGLAYRNIPVGHGTIADATFAEVRATLREVAGKRPTFVYCASGNRVGVALLPFFMLEQKMPEADAVMQAMRVGLRSADLLEQALAYARGRREG